MGVDQPPLEVAGAPGPGQAQLVDEVGRNPLAATVGEIAGGSQFVQLGIDQGVAAAAPAPALKQFAVFDCFAAAVLQAARGPEAGPVELGGPEEEFAPQQLLFQPLRAVIDALEGLVIEHGLPNAPH